MTLGERIRHYRQRRGLSQVVCANLVGLSVVARVMLSSGAG
ncbi:MAG: hypothetical protein ACRDYX_03835 [Egibacteraceae bacterium]